MAEDPPIVIGPGGARAIAKQTDEAASGFLGVILGGFEKVFAGTNVDEVRAAATDVFGAVVALLAGLSLIPTEANFGGIGAGRIVSEMMRPVTRRIVADNIDDQLRQYFRYRGISPFLVVRMVEQGVISPEIMRELAIDAGIKDKYIPVLNAYADYNQRQAILKYTQEAETAKTGLSVSTATNQVNRIVSQANTLLSAVETAEEAIVTLPLTRLVSSLEATSKSLDEQADIAEVGTDKEATAALKKINVLLRRAARLVAQASEI